MAMNRGDNIDFFMTWILPILIGLTLGYLLLGRKKTDVGQVFVLDAADFKANMRKGQLIDLRKQEAFDKQKIKGARRFTWRYLKSKQQTKIRKDRPLYIYCQNGLKSRRTARKLAKKGFKEVNVLKGGFNQYQ